MKLDELGWNPILAFYFDELTSQSTLNYQFRVGRVAVVHMTHCQLLTESGEISAVISAKIHQEAEDIELGGQFHEEFFDFPAVGDWVVFTKEAISDKAIIRGILPRRSSIYRNESGGAKRKAGEYKVKRQVLAANIDTIFLVNALNHDFNPRRIERYLAVVWESGANPVIVLNKADLCTDPQRKVAAVEKVARDIPIVVTSAVQDDGVDSIRRFIAPDQTVMLVGSSGVGKSSLINRLLGEERITVQPLSQANKGKHTTSYRELIRLPQGGLIIDTPGMREIGVWSSNESVAHFFADIDELATKCRFRNCTHTSEPGCAIQAAIERGDLAETRMQNYWKLQREIAWTESRLEKKVDRRARIGYNRHKKRQAQQRLAEVNF